MAAWVVFIPATLEKMIRYWVEEKLPDHRPTLLVVQEEQTRKPDLGVVRGHAQDRFDYDR